MFLPKWQCISPYCIESFPSRVDLWPWPLTLHFIGLQLCINRHLFMTFDLNWPMAVFVYMNPLTVTLTFIDLQLTINNPYGIMMTLESWDMPHIPTGRTTAICCVIGAIRLPMIGVNSQWIQKPAMQSLADTSWIVVHKQGYDGCLTAHLEDRPDRSLHDVSNNPCIPLWPF